MSGSAAIVGIRLSWRVAAGKPGPGGCDGRGGGGAVGAAPLRKPVQRRPRSSRPMQIDERPRLQGRQVRRAPIFTRYIEPEDL